VLYSAFGQPEKAKADVAKALELVQQNPHSSSYNNLAWVLATCPDAKVHEPVQAVALAKKAVELAPQSGLCWNTLGAAHYRAGDWKAASAALEKSMSLRKGGDGFDWFFLAMAHWQLGEKELSREWYDKAVAWMDKNKPNKPNLEDELQRFRAEAAGLLGLPAVQPTKEKDLTPSKE
jgi:uncharacterized protein HemY